MNRIIVIVLCCHDMGHIMCVCIYSDGPSRQCCVMCFVCCCCVCVAFSASCIDTCCVVYEACVVWWAPVCIRVFVYVCMYEFVHVVCVCVGIVWGA